jgi:hypothetical protein
MMLFLALAAIVGPWTLRTDFETGMRQGWESYPLAQDAGYDPTLDPAVYQGRKSLARRKAPNRDGELRLGFVRKTRVIAGPSPRLEFFYAIPSAGAVRLEVGIFAGDKPKVISLPARTGVWAEASTPIPALRADVEIRAVSITAVFAEAREGREEQFLIDDVRLSAQRERDLEILAPASLWDEDRRLHYVSRSYSPGEELRIQTRSSSAKVSLYNPENRLVREGATYRFTESDRAGLWRAEVQSSQGTATLLLLLRTARRSGLLFDELPPASNELLDLLSDRVTKLRASIRPELGPNIASYNDHWLLPGLPSYFALLQPPSEAAVLEALQYRHRGEEESLANARKILISMSAWPTWVHPWFPAHGYRTYYPVGIVASHLALAVDLIRSRLSSQELETIERGLLEKSIGPAFEEYVRNDRIAFHTSNWIGHAVGGALLAALEGGDPNLAGYALGLYTKQREHLEAAYTEDGSYGEGTSYMKFDMQTSSLVAAAAKRHLGQNLDVPLIRSWKHLLYASFGKGEALDHGDTHASIRPFGAYAYAAAQNSDGVLSRTYLDNKESGADSLLSRVLWEGLIRAPADVPKLPRSAVFPVRGNVTLRSGWDAGATVINMRAGANFNHNHADQGSVSLAHKGELLIDEAGYSDYYKDAYYQPYVIQALAHNTLLIDGDAESQVLPGNRYLGDVPKIIESFQGDEFDYACADLTPAYADRLERYTRTLLYRKGDTLIVVDRVKSREPHRFSVLWHPAAAPGATQGSVARIRKGEAAVDLQVFGSSALVTSSESAPLLLSQFANSESARVQRLPVLYYTTAEGSAEALFVSVLRPRSIEDAPASFSWSRAGGDYEVGAGSLVVRLGAGTLSAVDAKKMLFFRGTQWNDAQRSITATAPVTLEVIESGERPVVSIHADSPAQVRLQGFRLLPESFSVKAGTSRWP